MIYRGQESDRARMCGVANLRESGRMVEVKRKEACL